MEKTVKNPLFTLKGEELWSYIEKKTEERDLVVEQITTELESGVRNFKNDNKFQEAFVHPCTRSLGSYQCTYFDKYGPVGDFQAETFEELAAKIEDYGFTSCHEFTLTELARNQLNTKFSNNNSELDF